jgi:16S rRNA (guanine527-N7)-methyltransferase
VIAVTDERMRELLSPYLEQPLAADQYEMLREYLELLLKWNARTNLTAIRDEELVVQRHFGESLALAEFVLQHGEIVTAADLGSGAGFPGLPFAIYAPEIQVTLIESQNKKATFLKEVARALDLPNVSVRNERGEQVKEKFDVVMMRAVEKFDGALNVAAALAKPKGHIALLISEPQLQNVTRSLPIAGLWSTRDLANGAVVAVAKLI